MPRHPIGREAEPAGGSDLSGLPPEELERRAHEHVEAAFEELRGAGDTARKSLQPSGVVGKRVLWVVGGLAGLLLLRRLFRTRPRSGIGEEIAPESVGHAFGRAFLRNFGGLLGKALPGMIFYGLVRKQWGRAFGQGSGRGGGGRRSTF